MPIKSQIEPVDGRDIVKIALGRRSHRAQHLTALRGSPQIGAPLSVYLISGDKALSDDDLSTAELIGWKYPIVGGDSIGLAFLLITPEGVKFAGISHGPLPNRLLEAAILADEHLKSLGGEFELRLLEIPALHIFALWLCGAEGKNEFISLIDGQSPASSKLQIENNMRSLISSNPS